MPGPVAEAPSVQSFRPEIETAEDKSAREEEDRLDDLAREAQQTEQRIRRAKIIQANLPDKERWEMRLSEMKYPPEVPSQTRCLLNVDRLYIQEFVGVESNADFLAGKVKYEVMTRMGKRLFIGCERKATFEDMAFQLFDYSGRIMVEMAGRLAGPCKGTAIKVSTPLGFLGSVLQGDKLCAAHYSIVNWSGAEMFSILHPDYKASLCCWRDEVESSEYLVYTASRDFEPTLIGSICRHLPRQLKTKSLAEESAGNDAEIRQDMCCGVTFPAELDIQAKLLLLAALYVLDYRLIQRSGRDKRKAGRGKSNRYFGIHFLALVVGISLFSGLGIIFYFFEMNHNQLEAERIAWEQGQQRFVSG